MFPVQFGSGGGRGSDQVLEILHEAAPDPPRGSRVPRSQLRGAVPQRREGIPGRVRPVAARMPRGALRGDRAARARAATWGRGRVRHRDHPGKGRESRLGGLLGGSCRAVPGARDPARRRRGPDRPRPDRQDVGARALRLASRHHHRLESLVGRLRPRRGDAVLGRDLRPCVHEDGAGRSPFLDVRAESAGDGCGTRHVADDRRRRHRRPCEGDRRGLHEGPRPVARALRALPGSAWQRPHDRARVR